MTMRLELVPIWLLSTPQMWAVLVNTCRFTSTPGLWNPALSPMGSTASSRRIVPPRISPTSKATCPPGRVTRYSSRNTAPMTSVQASSLRDMVMPAATASASRPLNQQRSQLSPAYCTTSRNGGEVTVRATVPSASSGVLRASRVMKRAEAAAPWRLARSAAVRPFSSWRVFFRISSPVLR